MSRLDSRESHGGRKVFSGLFHRRTSQLGLTLVELLIAMTLGLLVLLAIGSIYVSSRQTFRMQDDNARLQETGRYALEVMGRSIRQAGFWNMSISAVDRATGFGGTAIAGTNGAAGAPDTVTVQSDWVKGNRDCNGNPANAAAETLAAGKQIQDSYSLANGQLQCAGQIATPATFTAVASQALVDNVEDIQILYGITSATDATRSATQYKAAPAAADWPNVVSARVCVQARSANQVNKVPQRFLNCGGALGTSTGALAFTTAAAGDLRLRRTFIATFNLRNRVP
jgi:type IV pilus assembly protein PilW